MNLNSILIFSENPKALSSFYAKVLGKKVEWEQGGYYGFMAGNTFLTIGLHDKIKGKTKEPERVMINFEVKNIEKEFERIKKAVDPKVVAKPYSMDGSGNMMIATLKDPDGNIFQLMTPFELDMEIPLKN